MIGCASGADEETLGQGAYELANDDGTEEVMINGRLYIHYAALSQSERAMLEDPELWQPPETVDKLAQLLRAVVTTEEYGDMIEVEPNYALARISLGLDGAGEPRGGGPSQVIDEGSSQDVEKTIFGADNRIQVTSFNGINLVHAMYEKGGGGVAVGGTKNVIYTAGHVLYNSPRDAGTDGWYCEDNSTSTANPSCPSPRSQPRWRFGGQIVSGTATWQTAWVKCGSKSTPTGWRNLPATASVTTAARWDYGVHDLSTCWPSNVGTVGWWVIPQATLRTGNIYHQGYPARYTCPNGSFGIPGDCPTNGAGQGVVQFLPTETTRPYTGGNQFASGASDPNATVGTGYITTNQVDLTVGQSGGALLKNDAGAWYAVGVSSRSTSTLNYFNAMTAEVQAFIFQ